MIEIIPMENRSTAKENIKLQLYISCFPAAGSSTDLRKEGAKTTFFIYFDIFCFILKYGIKNTYHLDYLEVS